MTPPEKSNKPFAGERAAQLTDDAFNLARLTRACVDVNEDVITAPNFNAVAVRAALIALAVKYSVTGDELVQMSQLAAWKLING